MQQTKARVMAVRVRDEVRIPTPLLSLIVPVADVRHFVRMTEVAAARHERTIRLAQQVAA